MAFFAPLLAPIIGGGLIGQAIVGIGLSFGVSYLSRKLQPKPSTSPSSSGGMQLSVSYDPNGPRQWAFGTIASAGTLVYHNTYGPNGNDYLQLVHKLADIPCSTFQGLYVDGVAASIGGSSVDANVAGSVITEYSGSLWAQYKSGAWSQSADSDLVSKATGGSYSSNNRGRGVCYVRMTAKANPDKFKNGRPQFLFVFRGALVYDWRKDTTNGGSGAHRFGDETTYEWSDNPAVILYNYKRGIYVNGEKVGGMNVPSDALPIDNWTAAANACDELVTKKDASTEKRYRANGIVNLDTEHGSVVRDLLASMAATISDTGGVFKVYPGIAQTAVMTITDDDIMPDGQVEFSPRLSRASLVNAVFGSFSNPAQMYQSASLPPRISPDDKEADGDTELTENYGLDFVTSGTQGQRVLEILRRRGRYQRSASFIGRPALSMLEAGDWIEWNSDRYGFDGVLFQVQQSTPARGRATALELRETAEAIYDFVAATDELDPLDPATVGAGGTRFDTVQNVELANTLLVGSGALQRPALTITWDAITDATVVGLALEFRRVGSAVAIERQILDPASGTYTWADSVQGDVSYEARLKPVVQPERPVTWTAWIDTSDLSEPQVVSVAELANAVPADTITPAMLSAQARFELSLIFETDAILGSASEMIADTVAFAERSHAAVTQSLIDGFENKAAIQVEQRQRQTADFALVEQITTVVAQINSNASQVQSQLTALATDVSAQAELIQTVTTALDGQTAQVTVLAESLNGVEGKFGIAISANNEVLGLVQLDANAIAGSTFTVAADNFRVSKLGTSGGASVPVFAIQTVGGVAKLALRGDMYADGTITANKLSVSVLSALSANLGEVTAGLIRNAANTLRFDLPNMRLYRADGTMQLDFQNKIFEIIF